MFLGYVEKSIVSEKRGENGKLGKIRGFAEHSDPPPSRGK